MILSQVKSGTIFSNFLIADDISAADAAAKELLTKIEAEAAAKKEEEDAAAAAEPADDEEVNSFLPVFYLTPEIKNFTLNQESLPEYTTEISEFYESPVYAKMHFQFLNSLTCVKRQFSGDTYLCQNAN